MWADYTLIHNFFEACALHRAGHQHEQKIKEKHRFMWQHAWKKRLTAMDGGRFHAEAIFWFCQNSLSKVYMDVHFWRYFRFAQRPFTTLFFHAFLIYSGLSLFFFTAESLSLWEKCGSIKTVHPCTVLMPSFVNKTRYCFVYPALHGGCFYSIQKSSPVLVRKPPVSLLSLKIFFHSWCPDYQLLSLHLSCSAVLFYSCGGFNTPTLAS